jgi:thiamine biosynthesis lipoprotein
MSVRIEITGVGIPESEVTRAAELGRGLAEEWENRFSRFRPQSQLARLNAAGGHAIPVDDTFMAMIETARRAVRRTGGRCDPSVLPALEAAGYDRSFEQIREAQFSPLADPPPAAGILGWERVEVDRGRNEVCLPPNMRIDLGGVAKGAFVDRLAAELAWWPGGCVDAGGDLLVWGVPPHGERWTIGLEDPFMAETDLLVAEIAPHAAVGIATSGTHRRRWRAGERDAHHLIDPRTGSPLADDLRCVTAFAPDVTTAEIATKALMVAASEPTIGESFDASLAVLVYGDGQIATVQEGMANDCAVSFAWPTDRSA